METTGLNTGAQFAVIARLLGECDDVRTAYWNTMRDGQRAQLDAREQFIKVECARLVIDGKHIDLRACPALPRPLPQ